MSEWSNKTVCGLFQYTSSTACQNGVTRLFMNCPVTSSTACQMETVYGLFQYTSSTACQNGVTRLFMDCSSILVVQRVRME